MGEEEEDKRSDGGLRKPRREAVQIYRPGMFRRGVDATVAGEPSQGSKPPEAPPKRPTKIQTSPLSSARSVGRLDQGPRRRSNDTESVKSYRGDSGSTTPDAASMCSERRNNWGRGGGVRTFTRGGGHARERNNDSMSECSVQSFVSTNSMRSDRVDYSNRSPRRGRNDSYNSREPYNSTQSLFNARQPGGYLEQPQKFNQRPPRMDTGGSRFVRNGAQNERASMRAETGHRRASGGRRRNDSINSTQSEYPQPTQELSVDTGPETQSQAGDALSTASMDYLTLCKSFESIGSFDWTTEMEEHQRRMEEDKTKELQKRLEACSNGIEVQKVVSQNQGRIRGIIRLNIEDGPPSVQQQQPQSSSNRENERPPPHPRTRRDNHRDRRYNGRRGSDCSSSVAGSIFEEDESEENCLASGERTPTDSRPQSAQSYQKERKHSRNRDSRNMGTGRRTYTPQDNQQHVERFERFERERPVQQQHQRTEVYSSSRLAGRLTRNGGSANRIDSVGVYQPPAMRRATDTVASSSSSKSNRDR